MRHSASDEEMRRLRSLEEIAQQSPSVEGYLQLAREYEKTGLHKEAERLIHKAERLEQGGHTEHLHVRGYLLGGNISSQMIVFEVLQVVSRAQLSGELILDCTGLIYRVYFQDGQVINTISPHREPGFASFLAATRLESGSYRFLEKQITNVPRLIEGNLDVLLLQAAQANDESTQPKAP